MNLIQANINAIAGVGTYMHIHAPATRVENVINGGWLELNGVAVSRTTYASLFTLYGTTYGAGDGVTTFNLPDAAGRTLISLAGTGGHTDVTSLGATEGAALASRRPAHGHSTALSFSGSAGTTSAGSAHSHSSSGLGFSGSGGTTSAGSPHAHGYTDLGHGHTATNNPRGWHTGSGSTGSGPFVYNSGTNLDPANPDTPVVTIGSSTVGITISNESTHTHTFTPAGSITGSTASESSHTHTFTPAGSVSGTVGATSAAPTDKPAYIVMGIWVVKF